MTTDNKLSPQNRTDQEPLLVSAPEAAKLCAISKASWHRLNSAGKIPASIPLGGRVLWRFAELKDWVQAGCPDRKSWELLQGREQT
jgi:predicted DNA-binding transcriptional regulator AlpA